MNGDDWVICDVNFAPGIRGLGLHEVYSYPEVAADIRAWFEKHDRSPNWCTDWEHELELMRIRLGR